MRLAVITAFAVCASALTVRANLLVNPDFSGWTNPNRPTGWFVEDTTKARVEQATNPVRSAPYAVKLTRRVAGTGNNAGIIQYVAVSPNLDYTLSVWFLDDDVNASGGCGISWYTQDTTFISSTTNAYTDSAIRTWQKVVKTATAPATAALAKVYFRVYGFTGSPAGGVVYLDDASFVQGSGVTEDKFYPAAQTCRLRISPNPTPGQTVMQVTLTQREQVKLAVYDLTGRIVSSVFSGVLNAGSHSFSWKAIDLDNKPLSNGLYFVLMSDASDKVAVAKLLIER